MLKQHLTLCVNFLIDARTFALPCWTTSPVIPREVEATAVLMRQLLLQVNDACGLSLDL